MNMDSSSLPDLPGDRGPAIMAVGWVGFFIATTFVILRLYTRLYVSNMKGWDDGLLIFSTFLNLMGLVMTTISVTHGLGRHQGSLPDNQVDLVYLYAGICQPFVVAASLVPKQAVVILLVRLMGAQKRGKWFLYSLIIILYIATALALIFMWVQCDPPSHYWHPFQQAKCWSPTILMDTTIFAGSWSAFVSLCLAAFPITILWDLKIKMRKKVMIASLMGLGVIAMAFGIIKTCYLPLVERPDFSWQFYHLLLWTFTETDIVIICACIPVLPPLIISIKHRRSSKTDVHMSAMANISAHHKNAMLRDPFWGDESWLSGLRSGNHISTVCAHAASPAIRNAKPIANNVIFKSIDFEQHMEYD